MNESNCTGNCLQGRKCDCPNELDGPSVITQLCDLLLAIIATGFVVWFAFKAEELLK